MLATFRSIAKSKLFLIILGAPLVVSLLLIGNVRDVFNNMSVRDAVVSANGRVIGSPEFKRQFDQRKKSAEEQSGRPITTEEAAAQGAVETILQGLAQREALMSILTKAGIRPSDTLLVAEVRKIPAFFNSVTRQFDQKQYDQQLTSAGVTPELFRQGISDELAQAHFTFAVADGIRAPDVYSALVASLMMQQRTMAAFGIDPRSVGEPEKPTDAQLNAFITAHKAEMMLPETRALTVVRLSAKALEPSITPDPAEVQKRYDFRKDTLSTPEKRTIVQVPAKDAATAAAAAARLTKGEDPADVARSLGGEPIVYKDAPKTAIADPAIAGPAFSLAQGQVSAPIQGSLGWAVVKVTGITLGRAVSLAEARPSLEAELKSEAAQDKVYAVVSKYEKAHDDGSSLKEAARTAGVTPFELPPVTPQGTDLKGQPQPLLTPKLLTEAFGLPEGGESEVVEDSKGEYFAVRVEKVLPAAVRSLATDREPITVYYMRTQVAGRLRAKLDGLAERIRKGESVDAVAASVGAKVQRLTLNRQQAEQDQTQRKQLFQAVFAAKPGEVFDMGAGLVKVESVKAGPLPEAALLTRGGEAQLRQSLLQDLIGEEALRWASKTAKVKIDDDRARAALALPPLDKKDAKKDAAATKTAAK